MAKKCIECGRKQGRFFSKHNYAGLDVRQAVENSWIHFSRNNTDLKLPGNPKMDYFCATCASRRTVNCKIHGEVQGKFSKGLPPICHHCEKSVRGRNCRDCKEISRGYRRTEFDDDMTCVEMFRLGIDANLRIINMAPHCNYFCGVYYIRNDR